MLWPSCLENCWGFLEFSCWLQQPLDGIVMIFGRLTSQTQGNHAPTTFQNTCQRGLSMPFSMNFVSQTESCLLSSTNSRKFVRRLHGIQTWHSSLLLGGLSAWMSWCPFGQIIGCVLEECFVLVSHIHWQWADVVSRRFYLRLRWLKGKIVQGRLEL